MRRRSLEVLVALGVMSPETEKSRVSSIAVFVLPTTNLYTSPIGCPDAEKTGQISETTYDARSHQARARTPPGAQRDMVQSLGRTLRSTNPASRSHRNDRPRQERQGAEPCGNHPRVDRRLDRQRYGRDGVGF